MFLSEEREKPIDMRSFEVLFDLNRDSSYRKIPFIELLVKKRFEKRNMFHFVFIFISDTDLDASSEKEIIFGLVTRMDLLNFITTQETKTE